MDGLVAVYGLVECDPNECECVLTLNARCNYT
jgi:hypothetical protein